MSQECGNCKHWKWQMDENMGRCNLYNTLLIHRNSYCADYRKIDKSEQKEIFVGC